MLMETLTEGVLLRNVEFLRKFNGSFEHKCIACAVSLFLEIFVFCLLCVISSFIPTYKQLKRAHKVFWCLAGVRALFGLRAVVFSILILTDSELWEDFVLSKTLSSQLFFTSIVGFFLFECSMLLISDILFKQRSYTLLIHHSLSLVGYSIGLFWDHGYFLGSIIVSLEMSTPFSCLCWVLMKAKMSETFIWKANQCLMVHLFHTRQNLLCVVMYIVVSHWWNFYQNMNVVLMTFLVGGAIIMFLGLNPYWTYRKTEQLFSRQDWNFKSGQTPDKNGVGNQSNHSNGTSNGHDPKGKETNSANSARNGVHLNSPKKKSEIRNAKKQK